MKIIIFQQGKEVRVEFHYDGKIETYNLERAEDFLVAIDKFIKKRHTGLDILKNADLEFTDTGLLTERIVRSIMTGLQFS